MRKKSRLIKPASWDIGTLTKNINFFCRHPVRAWGLPGLPDLSPGCPHPHHQPAAMPGSFQVVSYRTNLLATGFGSHEAEPSLSYFMPWCQRTAGKQR